MRLGVALALAGTLVLAGCGGGGGGGGSASLSPTEFRQQADAICAKYEQKIQDLGSPSSVDELSSFVGKAVPLVEQGNAELHKLQPPAELKSDWDRALEIQDEGVLKMHDLEEAVQNNDLTQVQAISAALDENQAESEQLAAKLGLQDCGKTTPSG